MYVFPTIICLWNKLKLLWNSIVPRRSNSDDNCGDGTVWALMGHCLDFLIK